MLGKLQGFPVALPTAGDRDLTLRVISPARVPVMDAGEILQSALRVIPGPVHAVFDRWNKRWFITSDAAKGEAFQFALGGAQSSLLLAPDGGQTGTALTWQLGSEWGTPYDAKARVLTAVKPKMSVYAVVNWVGSQSPAQFIYVNQGAAQVKFADYADHDAVRAAVESANAEVAIEIQPPTQAIWP